MSEIALIFQYFDLICFAFHQGCLFGLNVKHLFLRTSLWIFAQFSSKWYEMIQQRLFFNNYQKEVNIYKQYGLYKPTNLSGLEHNWLQELELINVFSDYHKTSYTFVRACTGHHATLNIKNKNSSSWPYGGAFPNGMSFQHICCCNLRFKWPRHEILFLELLLRIFLICHITKTFHFVFICLANLQNVQNLLLENSFWILHWSS